MKSYVTILTFILVSNCYAQSDLDKLLKGGEIIVNGLSFLIKDKSEVKENNSKVIEIVCIKNKLSDKQIFIIRSKDEEDNIFTIAAFKKKLKSRYCNCNMM